MAFFDNLKKKASVAMDKGTDKAKDLAEVTKLNRNIAAEEKQISMAYLDLGKAYFEKEKDNADVQEKELMNKIKVSMAAIEEMKSQIAKLKAKETSEPAAEEEPVEEEKAEEEVMYCPVCNGVIHKDDKFCAACGEKLS